MIYLRGGKKEKGLLACTRADVLGAAVCGAQFSGGEKTDEGTELG